MGGKHQQASHNRYVSNLGISDNLQETTIDVVKTMVSGRFFLKPIQFYICVVEKSHDNPIIQILWKSIAITICCCFFSTI